LVGVSRKTINAAEDGVFSPFTVLAVQLARARDQRAVALFSLRPDTIRERNLSRTTPVNRLVEVR
jgi:DNA-binding XRE family transcriptional regulator